MKRIIIDLLMLIIMLLEMSKIYTGTLIHEILGIILLILIFYHLFLNRKYLFNIFKAKYNFKSIFMLVINIMLLLSIIITILFGILSSQELFKQFNLDSLEIIKLHKIISYISFLIMGVHLGINLNAMIGKLSKKKQNKKINTIKVIAIVFCGVYSFIKVDFYKHLIGEYGFGISTTGLLINLIEYLFIILGVAIIINIFYRKIGEKKNER